MAHFRLTKVTGAGRQTRFSANGRRISRSEYDRIVNTAMSDPNGSMSCYRTVGKPVGTTVRRWNFSVASW